jgi:3'(2'), 5'-bisphosphate nucleotidase
MIAEGSADIYPRFGQTMEWDIAAGHALIRSTGGDIVDSNNQSITYGKVNFENPHFFAGTSRWLAKNQSF